jgi:lambda repressor-like predicted transcriptional regulator
VPGPGRDRAAGPLLSTDQYTDAGQALSGRELIQRFRSPYPWGMDQGPSSHHDSGLTGAPRPGRLMIDTELLERITAGESLRSLARERGVAHTTLGRRLKRPEVAAELRATKQRLRAQHARERRAEKELRRRAGHVAGRGGRRGKAARRPSDSEALWGSDCVSRNDELAAQTVAAGGGVKELIEATGLRTRLAVYESIDPEIVARALANDDQRPSSARQRAGPSRRFVPDPALVARRAAGEPLRRLAEGAGVSAATLSRSFASPEMAKELRLQQRKLRAQQENKARNAQRREEEAARLADHHASKISDIWCPIHRRRTYVRNVETSGSETRLEVEGCCDEAIQELVRWLKIHRAVLPTGAVFTPSGHAPANATVPPA